MSFLPRLLRILGVIAKYRLDDFLPRQPGTNGLRMLLLICRLPWLFSSRAKGDRNRRLRLAMEELGPIYIKFGQLLSTRQDFLEPALALELKSLQDNVPPFESPTISEIVSRTLGVEPELVFKELDPRPLASASVAQVHRAVLLNGEEVVVKVLRPDVEKTVAEDLALLTWLAEIIETQTLIGKRLRPIEVVADYEKVILDELNLQSEGANTSQLKRNFENSPSLYVPRVYWEFTRPEMLVTERIYGIPVTDIDALVAAGIDLKLLAETGVDIFFTQVFEHNFFHADMHPGNIFVSPDNPSQPRYIAIDCAIIGSLSDADKEYLAQNLLAIFKRDYRRVAALHVESGWVPPQTRISEFESAMRSVCEPIFEKPLKEISFAHLLVQLFRTAGRFDMEVQPSLVLLQKTLLNIEGLGRTLYPDLDLWETALPFLENWNRKRLSPLTLARRMQEELPNWIDELPQLPGQLISAMKETRQLGEINKTLKLQILEAERGRREVARRRRNGGLLALGIALLSLLPPVAAVLAGAPLATLGLALLGLYLLCFRY